MCPSPRPSPATGEGATALPLAAFLVMALLSGCAEPPPPQRPLTAFDGSTMGTYYRVQVAGDELSEERREEVEDAIVGAMEDVNARMSTYLDDSEISRLNRHRDGEPFPVSVETYEVLEAAYQISRRTGGAFDVTVGPLAEAWGFGPETELGTELVVPDVESILDLIGFDQLTLDGTAPAILKQHGELHVDLSGIAKGYAVDRVAERLESLGLDEYWVEIGGEVRASGANGRGVPWRLGIERPEMEPGVVQRIVPLDDQAVATSGDYRNYREIDGERFSHLLDPRTGWPIRHKLASVSVFHARCMTADGLATALMVLGEDEGYELAVRENLAALFLVRDGDDFVEKGTPAFWELAGRDGESSG